jgi:hypothetical protein
MTTDLDRSRLEAALEELQATVRADGVALHLGWEGETALVSVDLGDVECADCVLPPDALRAVIEGRLAPSLPAGTSLAVLDSRTAPVEAAGPTTIVVLDPTAQPEGGNPDSGPDAGPVAGRAVGFRTDILWRSWDWVTDEWQTALAAEGANVAEFRHIQGLAGPEGAEHHGAFSRFLDGLDVAVVGLGNCGSCTSWTIKDAVAAADSGCATVAVVTEEFEALGRTLAAQYGRPNLRILVLPYPLDTRPEPEVRELARARFAELGQVLGVTR